MKIVIDNKIPYIKGALERCAEVVYLPGNKTSREVVKDADALITRTRTICNRELLEGSDVKFIATATIGYDHIDTDYCREAGIEWTNAPGCNADSVNQYVAAALMAWSLNNRTDLEEKTIGIVGVGQVGSRVAKTCEILGMNVLLNDPPRERTEGPAGFVSLLKIQEESDIISFHVPLNLAGQDATFHMVNIQFLENLKKKPLLINTCRGEVFHTKEINRAMEEDVISGLVIDCWENEPDLSLELLNKSDYGTPHIAGYSKDGKANGTKMSVQAVSRFFGLGLDNWEPEGVEMPKNPNIELKGNMRRGSALLAEALLSTYNIEEDDDALRSNPELFETLRGDYPVRREFNSYTVITDGIDKQIVEKLVKLGFKVVNV